MLASQSPHRRAPLNTVVHPAGTELFLIQGDGCSLASANRAPLNDCDLELFRVLGQGCRAGHSRRSRANYHDMLLLFFGGIHIHRPSLFSLFLRT